MNFEAVKNIKRNFECVRSELNLKNVIKPPSSSLTYEQIALMH